MSLYLRILLVTISFGSCIYTIRKIRKAQLKIEESIYWFIFAVSIFLLSIFSEAEIAVAKWIGIDSPANLVFLAIIFLLILKVFTTTIRISLLEHKLTILTEELAILKNQIDNSNRIGENIENEEE